MKKRPASAASPARRRSKVFLAVADVPASTNSHSSNPAAGLSPTSAFPKLKLASGSFLVDLDEDEYGAVTSAPSALEPTGCRIDNQRRALKEWLEKNEGRYPQQNWKERRNPVEHALAKFVCHMRSMYKKGKMPESLRVALMELPRWSWHEKQDWQSQFEALKMWLEQANQIDEGEERTQGKTKYTKEKKKNKNAEENNLALPIKNQKRDKFVGAFTGGALDW